MGYKEKKEEQGLAYGILDRPSWFSSIFFGLQHFLACFSSILGTPLIITKYLCLSNNDYGYVVQTKIICSMFFGAGFATLLQCLIGVRLPILQGASFTFVIPAIALLQSNRFKCGDDLSVDEDTEDIWQMRMNAIQGGLIVSSAVEFGVGAFGLMGFLLRFIGPLTIAPVLISIGIALVAPAIDYCEGNWAIASIVIFVLILCTYVLHNVKIPWFQFSIKEKKCKRAKLMFFRLYPIVISMVVGLIFCGIFTATDVFPEGDASRLDNGRASGIAKAPWIYFPYPGQWGTPTFYASAIIGMLSGTLTSMIESIGDYFAAARMVAAPPTPTDGINRGILMEGFASIWCGLIGSTCGVTSYSGNIGALGITRNGSLRPMLMACILLMILGICPKITACLLWIPDPIIGGLFVVMGSVPTAVGMATLQYVNMNSNRNQFVLGFSVFCGIMIPSWITKDTINTPSEEFNELAFVLLSTNIFVAGFLAVCLDNILPGNKCDRGLNKWREQCEEDGDELLNRVYGYPFKKGHSFLKYVPIMPNFRKPAKNVLAEQSSDLCADVINDLSTNL